MEKEAVMRADAGEFPLAVKLRDLADGGNAPEWRWGPELEFAVVLEGRAEFLVGELSAEIREGEGIFVNANSMRAERRAGDGASIVATISFPPGLIADGEGGLVYEKYVAPILSESAPRFVLLSAEEGRSRDILAAAAELIRAYREAEWGYEFKCGNLASEMCRLLSLVLRIRSGESARRPSGGPAEKRMKEMLSFIHERYREDITVEDVAKAANVGKSECFRRFREVVGKSPVAYANEYRLKKSAELLRGSDMSVTEICISCGFSHISYFGKLFRRYYGVSPMRYRKAGRLRDEE